MLFVDLQALQPVYPEEIGENEALHSHMFSVEKFDAEGEFEKVRSRISIQQ